MSDTIEVCIICGIIESDHGGATHGYAKGGWREIATLPRGAHFRSRKVDPDAGLYITLEDQLQVVVTNSVAGAEVDIGVRLALPDGQIIPMNFQFFPTSARAVNKFTVQLAEGFLLSVDASTPTAGVRKGAMFCNLSLVRGAAASTITLYDLTEGYLTTGNDIGWPWPDNNYSVDQVGLLRSVLVGNPGAGADITVAVPAGARWELQSFNATFTASAVAGNRVPHFEIVDAGAHVLYNVPVNANIIANQVADVCGVQGVQSSNFDNTYVVTLPQNAQLLQGWILGTVTTGLLAGDAWSTIWLNVMEWMEL